MKPNLIIVGAGISGLSAGTYARMNGLETKIFELHSIPGGLCTAWERKGYTFDISMHMVTACKSGPFNTIWQELGVSENFKFHFHKQMTLVDGMGEKLDYSTNRDYLEKQLLEISPEDKKLIKDFVNLIFGPDMMNAASLKPEKTKTIFDRLKVIPAILPVLKYFIKYGNLTVQEFASRFKNPFLKEAIRFFIDAPGWPMKKFPMAVLAGFINSAVNEAGVPLGGSQQVVFSIAEQYKKLGGEIQYKARVKELIIEDDRVKGIILEDGTKHFADHVIWAGDGHHLIFDMLKGKYVSEKIQRMYAEWIPVKPIIHVMIGVNRDMSSESHRIIFEPQETINIAGKEFKWLAFLHHCFDKSMAPEGKSAVEVWYDTDFEYWEELAKVRKKYLAEKKRIADYTIEQLDRRWPGFAKDVEVVDVPTPATYKRYTGNWKGSPDGWYITPENMRDMEPLRTLPGLSGLQTIGQWTMPFTGTIMAAITGRQAIELLCRDSGLKFNTTSN